MKNNNQNKIKVVVFLFKKNQTQTKEQRVPQWGARGSRRTGLSSDLGQEHPDAPVPSGPQRREKLLPPGPQSLAAPPLCSGTGK